MFRTKKSKYFFKDRVKKLMRLKKNDKLKSLIEYEETYPALSDSTGTTVLHMAARCGNVEMMQYLIKLGCNIDAKDASGTMPLTIATKYNHCSAMKLLLDANADIFTANSAGEYPLQLVFDRTKKVYYSSIFNLYCQKVKSSSSNVEEAAEILSKAGCSLDHVAVAQDAELTRAYLDKIERLDDTISYRSIFISMLFIDCANLHVLFNYGSQVAQRIVGFLWYLHDMTNTAIVQQKQLNLYGQSRTLETVRVFSKKIVDWNLLNQENVKYVRYIFEDADKDILQVYLESGIASHVQSHLGYNLLPHVYGNRNPGVIELLQEKGLDLEARGSTKKQGMTALHLAIGRCIPNNVKILLSASADPNAINEQGETPLFRVLYSDEPVSYKIECIDLLLRSNADVEVCDGKGKRFIEYVALDNKDHLALAEHVLAHLAMLEATGTPVKQSTVEYINTHDKLKSRYETCQRQLDEMKTRKVVGSFSLMTVLISKPDKIARFVGAQVGKIIATLVHGESLRELNEYYSKKFKDHLDRALKIHKLRTKMDHLIVENMTSFRGYNAVVDRIISYFNFEELLVFE